MDLFEFAEYDEVIDSGMGWTIDGKELVRLTLFALEKYRSWVLTHREKQDIIAFAWMRMWEQIRKGQLGEINEKGEKLTKASFITRNIVWGVSRYFEGKPEVKYINLKEEDEDKYEWLADKVVGVEINEKEIVWDYLKEILTEREYEIIELRYKQELTFAVISDMLGKSRARVQQIAERGIRRTRKFLEKNPEKLKVLEEVAEMRMGKPDFMRWKEFDLNKRRKRQKYCREARKRKREHVLAGN